MKQHRSWRILGEEKRLAKPRRAAGVLEGGRDLRKGTEEVVQE